MNYYKKTKIVATIGPSTSSKEMLEKIILAGVDVCRINFSHGSHREYGRIVKSIREINRERNKNVAILADLQGPKIRIGEIKGREVVLTNGKRITIVAGEDVAGTAEKISVNYKDFARDCRKGDMILLDDGKLVLEVIQTQPGKKMVEAVVVSGGVLSSKKGVNLPNTKLSIPSLTEKDLKDLRFSLQQNVEWIALSFVRSAGDIKDLKRLIKKQGRSAHVIAKIEKPEAIRNIDEIISEANGLMVARGDLGVELPLEEVPMLQKELVRKSLKAAKPVIIATQMMESMISHYRPSRAEVNDVANAVMDGADAVMLSAETSVGKFPVQVVETMSRIIYQVEKSGKAYHFEYPPAERADRFITDSICYNATKLAQKVSARGIITMTHSGYTGFKISSFRPEAVIFVFSGNRAILNLMSLVWGVKTFYYNKFVSTDHTISDLKTTLKKGRFLKTGELVFNVSSWPIKE